MESASQRSSPTFKRQGDGSSANSIRKQESARNSKLLIYFAKLLPANEWKSIEIRE